MNLDVRFAWKVLKALRVTMLHDSVTFFIYSFGLVPVIGVFLGVAVPVFLGTGAHGAGNVFEGVLLNGGFALMLVGSSNFFQLMGVTIPIAIAGGHFPNAGTKAWRDAVLKNSIVGIVGGVTTGFGAPEIVRLYGALHPVQQYSTLLNNVVSYVFGLGFGGYQLLTTTRTLLTQRRQQMSSAAQQ